MAGLGAKLPLALSEEDGPYNLLKTYEELVKQNLRNVVLTAPGERMMDPFFGVGIRNFLFEMPGGDLHNNIKAKIMEHILFSEDIRSDSTLVVEIYYFIKPLNLQDMITINIAVN